MTKSRNIRDTGPRRPWTSAEEGILRDLYPDITCADIAALLGRKPGSVYQAAWRLGLQKSVYFWASDMSGRVTRGKQHPDIIANRFQPGFTPWNKGIHFVAGGRSASTQFKPGRLAHEARNYMPIGTLRVSKDGYLEQKVTDDPALASSRRWIGVHRLVWQAVHGPIPAGHVVCFKSAPYTAEESNFSADRLECITRAELARRNHPNSYNPALAKLVQLKGAITRQVNRIQRESTP